MLPKVAHVFRVTLSIQAFELSLAIRQTSPEFEPQSNVPCSTRKSLTVRSFDQAR